jgi:predicted permease
MARGDYRYSLRMILKTPGASAIAIFSLALGIGANTAIFSIIDTLLLKRLPVRSPQELYRVIAGKDRASWNYPDYVAFRDHNTSITLAACAGSSRPVGMQLADGDPAAPPEIAHTAVVSGNYFTMLGVEPRVGRVLNPEDDRVPSTSPYVVLSHDYWQARFSSDPRVVGRKLRLNGYPFTIVGVSRPGFRGLDPTASPDLYIPILMFGEISGEPFSRWNNRHWWWLQVIGRIRPGANTRQAETELFSVLRDQAESEKRTTRDTRFVSEAQPIRLEPSARGYSYVRSRLEKPLIVLMSVVGLVLLIACANVANLMLARGAARQREMAVRIALGATRSRLVGQLLIESILIALLGGVAGLALSFFGIQGLLTFVPQADAAQVAARITPDLRLLGFTTAVSFLTGMLSGIAPALRSTRPNLVPALKEDVPRIGGSSKFTLRNALVVAQVALSVLLLIVAGLFVRSLGKLRDIDLGFRPENTLVVSVDPSPNGYKGQRLREFYDRVRAEAEVLPGVRAVSLAAITPMSGSQWNGDFTVEGYQRQSSDVKYVDMNAVSLRFFETMGIPLVLGRDFREEDNPVRYPDPPTELVSGVESPEPPGPRYTIINESMARMFFRGRNPIGLHVSLSEKYDPARAYEVIGVVKDSRHLNLRDPLIPIVYVPTWRAIWASRSVCIRTTHEAPATVEAVRRLIARIDPSIPVTEATTMQRQIDENILEDRLIATLSGFFGMLALLLAGVGLYGVVSYSVARRTREIGIRVALGARRPAVLKLIVLDAALLVGVGASIGIPAALAATRYVKSLLYGVGTQDPVTIVGGTLALVAVAVLATFVPARRATKVDPMVALRYE